MKKLSTEIFLALLNTADGVLIDNGEEKGICSIKTPKPTITIANDLMTFLWMNSMEYSELVICITKCNPIMHENGIIFMHDLNGGIVSLHLLGKVNLLEIIDNAINILDSIRPSTLWMDEIEKIK